MRTLCTGLALFALAGLMAIQASAESSHETTFIKNHPHTSTYTLPDGRTFPRPFRVYDVDFTLMAGIADLQQIRETMQGSGLVPQTITQEGHEYGIVKLYIVNYTDTDLGPYHEMVLGFDSGKRPLSIPFVNEYSTLIPSMQPGYTIFLDKLVLDHSVPVDFGREQWGMDKDLGQIHLSDEPGQPQMKHAVIRNSAGETVLRVDFAIDKSVAALQAYAMGLMQALGLTQLPPPPAEIPFGVATRDVLNPQQFKFQDTVLAWSPSVHPFKGKFSPDSASAQGKILEQLHFVPLVIMNDAHAQFTMDDHVSLKR